MVDDELISLLTSNSSFDVIYPFVGENLSFINNHSVSDHLNFIYLDDDIHCLQFCKKGFFNFKKNIPSLLKIYEPRSTLLVDPCILIII